MAKLLNVNHTFTEIQEAVRHDKTSPFEFVVEYVHGNDNGFWRAYVKTDGRVRESSRSPHPSPAAAIDELQRLLTE